MFSTLGRLDQSAHDRCVSRSPIERELDREHVGVLGRGVEEGLHARGNTLVRVVHHHVTFADCLEDSTVDVPEGRWRHGHERRITKSRDLQRCDLHQVAQLEQRSHFMDVALGEHGAGRKALVLQLVERLVQRAGIELEPDELAVNVQVWRCERVERR